MKRNPLWLAFLFTLLTSTPLTATPPEDPAARKIYDHNYKWLSSFPASFIATNIRGANDKQYAERRQAALDLLREKRDLNTVPDMLDELKRRSFLSEQICDILGEWKAVKALPELTQISKDSSRPPEVREKAEKAVYLIKAREPDQGPPSY